MTAAGRFTSLSGLCVVEFWPVFQPLRFKGLIVDSVKLVVDTELTQDVASQGLGIVYESCDNDQKHKLVNALLDTLMTGKRSVCCTRTFYSYSPHIVTLGPLRCA